MLKILCVRTHNDFIFLYDNQTLVYVNTRVHWFVEPYNYTCFCFWNSLSVHLCWRIQAIKLLPSQTGTSFYPAYVDFSLPQRFAAFSRLQKIIKKNISMENISKGFNALIYSTERSICRFILKDLWTCQFLGVVFTMLNWN